MSIEKVEVNLTEMIPYGMATILFRARAQDRRDVTSAAVALGLTQSQFMRTVLIQAARKVLAEVASEGVANG